MAPIHLNANTVQVFKWHPLIVASGIGHFVVMMPNLRPSYPSFLTNLKLKKNYKNILIITWNLEHTREFGPNQIRRKIYAGFDN